jgi:hypothetical protein
MKMQKDQRRERYCGVGREGVNGEKEKKRCGSLKEVSIG